MRFVVRRFDSALLRKATLGSEACFQQPGHKRFRDSRQAGRQPELVTSRGHMLFAGSRRSEAAQQPSSSSLARGTEGDCRALYELPGLRRECTVWAQGGV